MRPGKLVQLSFVVPNLDEAIRQWLRGGETGPFFVMRRVALPVRYRGEIEPVDLSIGFAQLGSVHIELIEQHNDGPSVFRERHSPSVGGLHHLGFLVDDYDAAYSHYADRGFGVAMDLNYEGTPMVYFDTHGAIGAMTELIQDDARIRAMYDQIESASLDWDGSTPVRDF